VSFIKVNKIEKTYSGPEGGVHALEKINLEMEKGEFVAVMGPSGSGKSTLLTILGAMNPPSGGSLTVDGIDVYSLSTEKLADFRHEYLGFVFQQLQLIPYLTALENVMLPLVISKTEGSKEELALEALKKVGLADYAHRLPDQLSGGEQARVAIARAVVNEPLIILADEPTGNLDSKTGEEMMRLFKQLNEEGRTVIMVTHNEEAAQNAGRVVAIRDGSVVSS
jgi:putative ABC transport system ATP-binding protein